MTFAQLCVRTSGLLALSVACFVPSLALAQDADSLIERGIQLREQRQDEQALALFEQANGLSPTARTLTQIALAEQALERFLPAVLHLSEALQSNDPWIEERRSVLEDTLAAAARHVSRISVTGEPAGARVFLNGVLLGTLPTTPTWVNPAASVTLEVRAPGYATLRDQVALSVGEHVRHRVALQADGTGTEPEAQATGSSLADPAALEQPSSGGGTTINPVGPVLLGVGGASLIGGVILALLTLDADARLEAMCDGTNCFPSAQSILDERRSLAISADALLFGGATIAALGLVLTIVLEGE